MGVTLDASQEGLRRPWKASIEAVWDSFYEGFRRAVVDTSIWVSAALGSLTLFTQHVLELGWDPRPGLLVFCSGLAIYNLDHAHDPKSRKLPDETAEEFFSSFPFLLLMVSGFIGSGLIVSTAPLPAKSVFGLYLAVGMAYGLPLLPSLRPGGLRLEELWQHAGPLAKLAFLRDRFHYTAIKEFPGLKAWITSGALTLAAVGLPLGWHGISLTRLPLTSPAWMLFFFVFAFASCNTHAFDVRDIDEDLARPISRQVRTLPTLISLKDLKRGLSLLILSVLLLLTAGEKLGWFGGMTLSHPEIIVGGAIALGYVQFLSRSWQRDAYDIWVEGTFFLLPLLAALHGHLH